VLHNHAFSRQCWQYSHDASAYGSIADADHICGNSIAQYGFTAGWWSYSWPNSNSATYTGEPASNPLVVQDETSFGYYNICVPNGNGCSPSVSVYLNFAHPSFRWPRSDADAGVNSVAPTDASVTVCDASGAYAPVLDFPSTATSRTIGVASSPPPAPEAQITPGAPPPPFTPPLPPAAPPPYVYTLQTLEYEPSPTAPACAQTISVSASPIDVVSASECASALSQLALGASADPVMSGNYSGGFRCFSNSSNVFVWSVVATGSPSGTYVCRYE
jgi:hypothetical protein